MKIYYAKKMGDVAKATEGSAFMAACLRSEGFYTITTEANVDLHGTMKEIEKQLKLMQVPYEKKCRFKQRLGRKGQKKSLVS